MLKVVNAAVKKAYGEQAPHRLDGNLLRREGYRALYGAVLSGRDAAGAA